ncbi:MAG: lysylphosphatidylglycerol synthase transmembrane domain-containing protein [Rickettsiales bacterium]
MSLAKYSKQLSLLAKIAFMLLAFWFVVKTVDMEELRTMLKAQDRYVLMEVAFLLSMQIFLGALRWRLLLISLSESSKNTLSFLKSLKTYYISIFFNCCLPGTVGGDVVRVWLVKSDGIPLTTAISSVVIDRLLTLFALVLMVFLTVPIFASYLKINAWIPVPIFLLFIIIGLWSLFNLEKVVKKIPLIKSMHWLEHILQSLRLVMKKPKTTICSILYAVSAHITFCLSAYLLAESFGTPISLIACFTLIPWVLLIAIIPISIGGWGLREVAMIFTLSLIGVPKEAALALSIQLGLMAIIISVPAGILWIVNRKSNHETKIN